MTRSEAMNDIMRLLDSNMDTAKQILGQANPDQAIAMHAIVSVCGWLSEMCKILAQSLPEEEMTKEARTE